MTTLVEILKQNKQYDKEKKDIASKLASFLETEKNNQSVDRNY